MTTRQQLDEEMEKIKTRCDILVYLFKNGRITFNELQSTKNILLHNMQDSIIRIVTAALEEAILDKDHERFTKCSCGNEETHDFIIGQYSITQDILNSLQE